MLNQFSIPYALLSLVLLSACSIGTGEKVKNPIDRSTTSSQPEDSYLWLEDVEGDAALQWVRDEKDPRRGSRGATKGR